MISGPLWGYFLVTICHYLSLIATNRMQQRIRDAVSTCHYMSLYLSLPTPLPHPVQDVRCTVVHLRRTLIHGRHAPRERTGGSAEPDPHVAAGDD